MMNATECSKLGPPLSPFEEVAHTLDRARALAARVEQLHNRLLGDRPEACASKSDPAQSGLLGSLSDDAKRTASICIDAFTRIDAIERSLP